MSSAPIASESSNKLAVCHLPWIVEKASLPIPNYQFSFLGGFHEELMLSLSPRIYIYTDRAMYLVLVSPIEPARTPKKRCK